MMRVMKSHERGRANHGWLESWHSFSFADYYNPQAMGFRALRVINEDTIAGASGFPTHGHRDMEIITYMVDGELTHKDTLGNTEVIKRGEVQRMSAGTGVRHSEFNMQSEKKAHLLQIWILPDAENHKPSYGQKDFSKEFDSQKLVLTVSADGRDGSLQMNQDASLYVGRWKKAERIEKDLDPKRSAWVQVIKGPLTVNGQVLEEGDALALREERKLVIDSSGAAEFLFFDLH